jgi:hypothetical protein
MAPKKHLQQFDGGTRAVYVTNPEMAREYAILKASGIYLLSGQPDGARRLTLYPVGHYFRCGNPLLLSGLTLGIIPGFLPGGRVFDYDLETDGVSERYVHHLPVWERFSIWEWLLQRDEDKVLAEALVWSANGLQPANHALHQKSSSAASRSVEQ